MVVALSTSIGSFWAFWGIIENFHEGWFHESLLLNSGLMIVQYLSPLIIFVSITQLAIAFPRVGSVAHVLGGLLLSLLLFVIYWLTANEIDDEKAYIIVYDGKVWPRRKRFAPAYLAYRCVKPVEVHLQNH